MNRIFKHATGAVLEGALISLLVVGLMAGTAFAAKSGGAHVKPGGSGGGSVAMVLVTDVNGNLAANWGDSISYTVSTTATIYPYVSTQCTQGGVLVLSDSAGFFPSYAWPASRVITLSTARWTGGAASCTAKLYSMDSGSQTILNSLSFSVGA